MDETSVQVYDTQQLAAISREEIDMQIATAKRYPRDEVKAVEKAIMLATKKIKTAQACRYFRPVGKKDGRQQFAGGASIRMAEIMKTSWGNLRIAKRSMGTRDGMVGVEWGVHDLESNVMEKGEVWRPYFGSEKMIPVITAAAMKFAERDAVFAVIPKTEADDVWDACKATILGSEKDQVELRKAIEASFKTMGVEKKTLYAVVDRKEYPEGSGDELIFLIGLNNAIKDGLCSVDDAFGKSGSTKPSGLGAPAEKRPAATGKKGKAAEAQEKAPEGPEEKESPEAQTEDSAPVSEYEDSVLTLASELRWSNINLMDQVEKKLGIRNWQRANADQQKEVLLWLNQQIAAR